MLELTRPYVNVASTSIVQTAERLLAGLRGSTSELLEREATQMSWYWVEPWHAMEREVDEFVRRGDVQVFDSIEEFLADLDE